MTLGWYFQETTDGGWSGFNDAGIGHFKGNRYGNLAREVIQNSLDARDKQADPDDPVIVEFNLKRIDTNQIPDLLALKNAFNLCRKSTEHEGDKAKVFFDRADELLGQSKLNILEIVEHNTSGMIGPCENGTSYFAYMKATGQSHKSRLSGGSHGIGKNAPLVVSELRTIFLATCWRDENGNLNRYYQGRANLMSHDEGDTRFGPVGYWGELDGCMPISDPDSTPDWLERDDVGTSICVLGFHKRKEWKDQLFAAVAENFFASIARGELEVLVDGLKIDSETIEQITTNERIRESISSLKGQPASFDLSHHFLSCDTGDEDRTVCEETEQLHLGRCSVKISVYEGAPKKVCMLRNGMLITTELERLRTFANMKDFVAIVECHSDKGLRLLRSMEPPRHDSFDPEELDTEDEQRKGSQALKSLGERVRELLKIHAQVELTENGSVDFIAPLFQDEAEENTNRNSVDRDPDGELLFQPKPIKSPPTGKTTTEDDIADPDDGEEGTEGGAGGGGGGGGDGGGTGPGDGTGSGGTGNRGSGSDKSQSIHLIDVRTVPNGNGELDVFFTPQSDHLANVRVSSLGADVEDALMIVESSDGELAGGILQLSLKKGERTKVTLKTDRQSEGGYKVSANEI